jgi:hypothetical protein
MQVVAATVSTALKAAANPGRARAETGNDIVGPFMAGKNRRKCDVPGRKYRIPVKMEWS